MAQGRKVTAETTERILNGLRLGMTRRAAAAHAGIHVRTFYRMLENDDADGTLATEVEKAEAHAEGTYTAIVAEAAGKTWQAAAWWLERRRYQEYAKREKVEMTGEDGGPIDHRNVSALTDHERTALSEAIRHHLRDQGRPTEAARDAEAPVEG